MMNDSLNQVSIRAVISAEAGILADLSRRTFYDTFAPVNTEADMEKFMRLQFSRDQLTAEVDLPGNRFFIAWLNDQPAGYLFLKDAAHPALNTDQSIEISRLYADQGYIGKGVGKSLMQFAVNTTRAENNTVIWLGVWEHNTRAINFYKAFGFEKFAEHDFILGDDVQRDWLMKKSL
jgi:ribosomal protein S18 acetylase RimI-like enzyme